ncbi:MAG: hypothetical protein HKN87_04555 [Saprospiraceae bacterium]|nr:hypothetical protein [Saprospiraceae bacterium]
MKIRQHLFLTLILLVTIDSFAGGPWPQSKGKGYFKLAEWWMVADQHFTDTGLKDPNITAGLFNTSIYAEYGLTNRLTGMVYFPFFSRSLFNNQISGTTGELIKVGEALNSIGDADLTIKYGLTRADAVVPMSLSLVLGLPLGEVGGGSENALQTGDGEFNQMIRMDIGKSPNTGKLALYVSSYLAFNNRTNDFSDEVRSGIEVGGAIMQRKLWLIGRLDRLWSLKNGLPSGSNPTASIFANNAAFLNVGVEVNGYLTDQLGVSAGITAPLTGEIIYAAPAYSVGVFYDMR